MFRLGKVAIIRSCISTV